MSCVCRKAKVRGRKLSRRRSSRWRLKWLSRWKDEGERCRPLQLSFPSCNLPNDWEQVSQGEQGNHLPRRSWRRSSASSLSSSPPPRVDPEDKGNQRAEEDGEQNSWFYVTAHRKRPPAPRTANKKGETRTPFVTLLIPLKGSLRLSCGFLSSTSLLTPSVDPSCNPGDTWIG